MVQWPVPAYHQDDGHFGFEVTIRYADALFKSWMEVHPGGMIEMKDDEPIAADLPIRSDKRANGLQLLQDSDATHD